MNRCYAISREQRTFLCLDVDPWAGGSLLFAQHNESSKVMKKCVFCEIAAGRASASLVHDDELAMALMTINPANPGHTLVVPKEHVTNLVDLGDRLGEHLFNLTVKIAEAIKKSGLRCEGIDLFLSDGEPQQEILHLHMHIVPRFHDDGLSVDLGRTRPKRSELEKTASMIRRAYNTLSSKTTEH